MHKCKELLQRLGCLEFLVFLRLQIDGKYYSGKTHKTHLYNKVLLLPKSLSPLRISDGEQIRVMVQVYMAERTGLQR